MYLRSQSRKRTVIIQNEMAHEKQLPCSVARKMFCTMHKWMTNAHSKPNYLHNNPSEYETFSFWILNFGHCYLLDKWGIWPSYWVPTLRTLPLNQGLARVVNRRIITTTGTCLLICPPKNNDSKITTRVLNCTISARRYFSRFNFPLLRRVNEIRGDKFPESTPTKVLFS